MRLAKSGQRWLLADLKVKSSCPATKTMTMIHTVAGAMVQPAARAPNAQGRRAEVPERVPGMKVQSVKVQSVRVPGAMVQSAKVPGGTVPDGTVAGRLAP